MKQKMTQDNLENNNLFALGNNKDPCWERIPDLSGEINELLKKGKPSSEGKPPIVEPDTNPEAKSNLNGYIYVPSINLYIAEEKILFGKDFYATQELLHKGNLRMPTIPEFVEFLKYVKINNKNIYNEITEVRDPWRAEWLDADFKVEGKDLVVYYHVFDKTGKIIKKKEILDRETLMSAETPGISLESWLKNPTKQGLPTSKTKKGNFYYWCPSKNNNSVARFYAYSDWVNFDLDRNSSNHNSTLGVRPVKLAK
jgi:hypothetical protein